MLRLSISEVLQLLNFLSKLLISILRRPRLGVPEIEILISATLCDTLQSMKIPVLKFCDQLRSQSNRHVMSFYLWARDVTSAFNHGAKILQHTATNGNDLSYNVKKCNKPKFCDTLRHFATDHLMKSGLKVIRIKP